MQARLSRFSNVLLSAGTHCVIPAGERGKEGKCNS
jgi:hypothetical protein